ncbi:permease prefix domain 1-containing protein [Actinocorallia sp. API 0066]|uniref:permease prefix domain 1-containing protein n=1 Tax=Actinocorallia sp. API 0066 TaxID=2896846 RepID=UPI0027E1BE54|nr:permease prefix domain 1-containing protein [Actinocorallia sp. API 0066]
MRELESALHGPQRVRARLVEEIQGGLEEAVAELAEEGWAVRDAEREAVRRFGPVAEVAAACQRELTVAQARHTAWAVALAVPVPLACWAPLWEGTAARLLALPFAAVAAGAALLAVAVLAATGGLARRLPAPGALPRAMAWTGTAASVALALGTAASCLAALRGIDGPLLALAVTTALAGHGAVAASARACRACLRLAS